MKTNPYSFWAKIIAIAFIILVIVIGLAQQPYINYEGSVNGTNWIYGDTHALNFETVPTVINGITAVTSIIIGFSVAIVGLVYREDFKKDRKVRITLLTLAFYSAVPLTILLVVYDSLIQGALEFALKWALYAIILALADFIISMLAIFYRLDKQKDTELGRGDSDTHKQEKSETEGKPETKEAEKNDEEKKKALRIMYKNLRDDNWQRGQGIWIANSILVTGSLFVVFQSQFVGALTYLIALMLVGIANFLHVTTEMVTAITYKQMEKIGHEIGLDKVKDMYESDIRKNWWYPFRKGASYVLFSFLIAGYLFLWLNDLGLSVSMFVTLLFLNLAGIFYYLYFKK